MKESFSMEIHNFDWVLQGSLVGPFNFVDILNLIFILKIFAKDYVYPQQYVLQWCFSITLEKVFE